MNVGDGLGDKGWGRGGGAAGIGFKIGGLLEGGAVIGGDGGVGGGFIDEHCSGGAWLRFLFLLGDVDDA